MNKVLNFIAGLAALFISGLAALFSGLAALFKAPPRPLPLAAVDPVPPSPAALVATLLPPVLLWTWAVRNLKTGRILTAYVGPTIEEAGRSCQDCALRAGRCYAWRSGQLAGAENVYLNAREFPLNYRLEAALARQKKHPSVARLCAIGDATRVDHRAVMADIETLRGLQFAILAFTHFWRDPKNRDFRGHMMASCDSLEDADTALAQGWRPAVVLPPGHVGLTFVTPGGAKGLVCPEQTGRAQNCASCRLCDVRHRVWGKIDMIGFLEHGAHKVQSREDSAGDAAAPAGAAAESTTHRALPMADALVVSSEPVPNAPATSFTEPPPGSWIQASQAPAPEPVAYVVAPCIPRGCLTLLEGVPGDGKSTFLGSAVASVTSGTDMAWGRLDVRGGSVGWIGEEARDVVIARLERAGADLDLCWVVTGPYDLAATATEILARKPALLVIDPIDCIVSTGASNPREILQPLLAAAQRSNTAIVAVRHWRKAPSRRAIHSGIGSIHWVGVARSVLSFGVFPVDEAESPSRVLIHVKNNFGPPGPSQEFSWVNGRLQWIRSGGLTAGDLSERGRGPRAGTEEERAAAFLREKLADGPRPVDELIRLAAEQGISSRTLRRARESLGFESHRSRRADGRFGGFTWGGPGGASG